MTTNQYFRVETDYRVGFQEHVSLARVQTVDEAVLRRRRLFYRHHTETTEQLQYIRRVLQSNSSLRIGFGWSFESTAFMINLFDECYADLIPRFERQITIPRTVSDFRADWFGFETFNLFDQTALEGLDAYQMIVFNNSLIDFQIDMVRFVVQHPHYRAHQLCRDDSFRYARFKQARQNPDSLEDLTKEYLDSLKITTGMLSFPREIIEQSIGMHFLNHSSLFFELMDFYSLQGTIYDHA